MSQAIDFALLVVVGIHLALLRRLVMDVGWMQAAATSQMRVVPDSGQPYSFKLAPPPGHPSPPFRGDLLGGGLLSSHDLKGESTALLFVDPTRLPARPDRRLQAATRILFHRMNGRAFWVCQGTSAACALLEDYRVGRRDVPVILDSTREISRTFGVGHFEAAILGPDGDLQSFGYVELGVDVPDGDEAESR